MSYKQAMKIAINTNRYVSILIHNKIGIVHCIFKEVDLLVWEEIYDEKINTNFIDKN